MFLKLRKSASPVVLEIVLCFSGWKSEPYLSCVFGGLGKEGSVSSFQPQKSRLRGNCAGVCVCGMGGCWGQCAWPSTRDGGLVMLVPNLACTRLNSVSGMGERCFSPTLQSRFVQPPE